MIKYGRKLLSSILAASMVFSSAATTMVATAAPVYAEEVEVTTSDETGVSWEIVDGTLIISGNGPMEDHDWEDDFPWYDERTSFTKVVVEEGVTTVGANAFGYDSYLTEVTLPSTIESINECAFFYCTNLTTITMGGNAPVLNSWGQLSGCNALTTINVPAGATGYDVSPWTNYTVAEYGAAEVSKTHAIEVTSIMRDTGKPSGMYTFEGAIVTEQEDGTYLVRMHQASVNRNVLALTDDKDAAKAHAVDWYIGTGADGYWFTIPVASLDETLYAVMSSESRIAAGNDFSNVIAITFDAESMTDTEEADAVAEDMNINPAVPAEVSKTHAIEVTSIMRDTGKPSGMYTFEGAIVTEQEDGTYLVRMHQASVNRNVLALTDDKDAAKAHAVDWYIGTGADGYWFTIPVASLDETLYAVMSSESRIVAGNDFSNVIAITFDAESMIDTEEADAVAEDMNISPAVPAETTTPYTVTANNTGMFKVVDAYMVQVGDTKTLYITLNGTGYRSLFKGTYEEATATGTDETQWINGVVRADETEFNGKYEFAIPVEEGDSYMQINARSFSKGTWYPRYILIDQAAATLESGDYEETFDLAVVNQNDAAVASAAMTVTAGPNSNNYLVSADVEVPGYVQAYVGSAADAAEATEGIIEAEAGKFTIQVEKLVTPGSTALDTIMDQPTAVSFKDADGNWAEYTLTFSKANKSLTADYVIPVPEFSVDPIEITVNVGETFELGVVNGDPNPGTYTYYWYSGSESGIVSRVGNAYGTTKQYTAVAAGDTTIKVVWDEPYIASECTVHVVDPTPQATAIITQPEDFIGSVGDTASFSIEAEGTDLVYQWYYSKNGTKWIASAASGADSAAISFKVTTANKANIYKCVVTGADEVTVTSETAAVVVPQSAVITKNPETVIANKGDMVTFKVEAEHAVAYQWYYTKDGSKWYKSAAEGADSAEFTIKAATSNMSNVYRCKVTGEDGSTVVSESAGITVPQPAEILTQPVNYDVAMGETASFTVEAVHAAAYQWYYSKDGVKWYKSGAEGADTATLTLKKSSSTSTNTYRCKITGEDGKAIYTDSVGF